uniref:Bcl-2 Bcl-2 homology region 1-3 domain-containing protein n=1 Tax=Pundamilia nyererei TaxID=303518 RepID=A0A3B4H829_9CICH
MPQPRTSERVVRPCWLNIDASGPRVIVSDGLSQSVRHLNDPPTFGSGWLADAAGMIHIAGSYDTYKCVDCNIVLSGYKKADRSLNEHVLRMLSLQTTAAAEVSTVTRVARTLFSDGIINWGRIVSLVAYGTVLLQASKSTLGPECCSIGAPPPLLLYCPSQGPVGGSVGSFSDPPTGRSVVTLT